MIQTKYGNSIIPALITICSMVVVVAYSVFLATGSIDPDIYFIIKNGEDIMNWGFPDKMLHTVLDIKTVLQQSFTNVLVYHFYKWFSFNGVYILSALEFVIMFLTVSHYAGLKIKDPFARYTSCAFLMIPAAMLLKGRPLIISFTLLFGLMACTEHYRMTKNANFILFAWTILSFVQIMFHASMWPFLTAFAAADVLTFIIHKDKPGTITGLFGLIMMTLVAMLNPYGIKNMFYTLYSLPITSSSIQEFNKPQVLSAFGLYIFLCLFMFIIYLKKFFELNNIIPVIVFVTCFFMAVMYRRNLWLLSAGSAYLYSGHIDKFLADITLKGSVSASEPVKGGSEVSFPKFLCLKKLPDQNDALNAGLFSCFTAFVLAGAIIISAYPCIPMSKTELIHDCYYSPVSAADYLDSLDIKVRLYTGFNNGAYMRFRGYDTYLDARPELYIPAFTGDEFDYFDEYTQLKTDPDFDIRGFIDKYSFTHLLVEKDSFMYIYVRDHSGYVKEVDTGDYALFTVAEN